MAPESPAGVGTRSSARISPDLVDERPGDLRSADVDADRMHGADLPRTVAVVTAPTGGRRCTLRVESPPDASTGTEGAAVNEYFDVPPSSRPTRQANVTDLLVDRVAATPDAPLFALPDRDGGWTRRHRRRVPRAGRRPGEGPRRRRHPARRQDRLHVHDPLRVDARRLRDLVRRRRAGARSTRPARPSQIQWILTDSGAIARSSSRPPSTSPASTRSRGDVPAGRARSGRCDLGDLDKLVAAGRGVADAEIERRRNARRRHRHRDPHLHVRLDRAAEGLRAHPLQLRRAHAATPRSR